MTKYLLITVVTLSFCQLACGQSAEIYGFFAPGQVRASSNADLGFGSEFAINAGGGAKYITHSGFGAGIESGIAGPTNDWKYYNFGVISGNGYYVFRQDGKVEPFVTGGFTHTYGYDAVDRNGGNFGAGITYWLNKRAGLLLEFRDHVARTEGVTLQLLNARVGFVLRFR